MNKINCIIGLFLSFITTLFVGFTIGVQVLLIFFIADYITGFLDGVFGVSDKTSSGKLNSKIGLRGIVKKVFMLILVMVGNQCDLLLNVNFVRDCVIFALISNELISLLENIGLMGVHYPQILNNIIDVLNNKSNRTNSAD